MSAVQMESTIFPTVFSNAIPMASPNPARISPSQSNNNYHPFMAESSLAVVLSENVQKNLYFNWTILENGPDVGGCGQGE